jgi:hypothetical protein
LPRSCIELGGKLESFFKEMNVKMKEREDPKRRDLAFMEGEKVWLSSRNWSWRFGTRKLCPKWLGPFELGGLWSRRLL